MRQPYTMSHRWIGLWQVLSLGHSPPHPALRLVGNLVASPEGPINEIDPETIRISMPVQVVFQAAGEDIVLPRWMPA